MDALVDTAWTAERLGRPGIVVLDATYVAIQPDPPRDEAAEYHAGHVPGARFMDLRALSTGQTTSLPSPGKFAGHLRALGIANGDRVVLYDASPHRTAARAWWLFRLFVPDLAVAILDGGLAKWRAEGRPLDTGEPAPPPPGTLVLDPDPARSLDKAAMLAIAGARDGQIVDARSGARFAGTEPDPHGVAAGHIPGAANLPYTQFFQADGTFLPCDMLRERFAAVGIDVARPVATTCGSGITAAVPAFALTLIGGDAGLYHGSWSEWAADPDTPKVTA